jgi:hypothetical protein
MANTGIKNVVTLHLVYPPYPPGSPVNPPQVKPNQIGQSDYISPYQDLDDCAVGASTDCPETLIATGGTGQAEAEFSLPPSTYMNPAIVTVRVKVMNGGTVVGSHDFVLSSQTYNYFYTLITGLTSGSRTIAIDYLNASSTVIGSCSGLATISIA